VTVSVEYFLAMAEADAWADELAAIEAERSVKRGECACDQPADEVPAK
jgi:hypothetical protein